MTLFQLFNTKPDELIMEKILLCFGLDNLEDTTVFTKKDLKEINAVENLEKIIDEIETYYLPCKRKKYLRDLNYKNIITILRQFVKCYDYFIFSKEKYIQGEKYITYQIMPLDKKTFLKMRKKDETYIVSFD